MLDDFKKRLDACQFIKDDEERLHVLKKLKSDIMKLLFEEKNKNIHNELIDMIKKSSWN